MAVPDFSKIWASQSSLTPYEFSDEDYLDGWKFVGEIPPARFMFDAWQRQADTKMQWLKNNMLGYLLRQNSTQYAVGDIAFSASLPSSLVLKCTTAGITAATEPDMSGAEAGWTVQDGGVVWKYMPLGTLSREIVPAFNHRDVIAASGTYTAPVTGWYKITVVGGGGGGNNALSPYAGGGGGGGGITIAYEKLAAGDSIPVVIGAGGAANNDGGDSSVTVGGNTYTGGKGTHGTATRSGGTGGTGTLSGFHGVSAGWVAVTGYNIGGGDGGWPNGGYGGSTPSNVGGAGSAGFVWFEYFAAV